MMWPLHLEHYCEQHVQQKKIRDDTLKYAVKWSAVPFKPPIDKPAGKVLKFEDKFKALYILR
jgi:hypothetical protein